MRTLLQLAFFGSLLAGAAAPISAQERGSGTVTGTVTRKSDGSRLAAVSVSVRGAAASAVTGTDGHFVLQRVPEGAQTLLFRWLGYQPREASVQVTAGGTHTVDVALEAQPITLDSSQPKRNATVILFGTFSSLRAAAAISSRCSPTRRSPPGSSALPHVLTRG